MIKSKTIILLILISLIAFSCEKDEPPFVEKNDKTLLVYIMGENSLSQFIEDDIAEMERGFKTSDYNNLILFIDDYSKPRIVRVEKNNSGESIRNEVFLYEKELLSTDPDVMKEVFSYVFKRYPAESYGLVLWSHGDGWLPDYDGRSRWIGQDGGNYGPKMNIPELASVLKQFPKFEFIFFDACFMQSIEVAYELRNYAEYIIGSPTETPGPGAPYQLMIPIMLKKQANMEKMVNDYYRYYSTSASQHEWTYGAAISVIKCSELEKLCTETKKIVSEYKDYLGNADLSKVQMYDFRNGINSSKKSCLYYDINSFFKSFVNEKGYNIWKQQLDKCMPYKATTNSCYSGPGRCSFPIDTEQYSGLSTYILQTGNNYSKWNDYYKELNWYKDAGWSMTIW